MLAFANVLMMKELWQLKAAEKWEAGKQILWRQNVGQLQASLG